MAKSNQNKSDTDKARELKNQLSDLISKSKLNPQEKEILKLRFGTDDQPLTIEEVALHLNRTTEEIEQIEAKALGKIRHPEKRNRLKDYLGH